MQTGIFYYNIESYEKSGLSFRFYAQKTGKTIDGSRDVRAASYTIELSPSFADLGVERIQQVDEEVLLKGDAIS